MNDEQMDDLKQFIDSKVSQSELRIRDDLGGRADSLEDRIDKLEQKVDDGFAGVGDALEVQNKHVDERLTGLEQQTA